MTDELKWLPEHIFLVPSLILRYKLREVLTPEEKIILDNWIEEKANNKIFFEQMMSEGISTQHWQVYDRFEKNKQVAAVIAGKQVFRKSVLRTMQAIKRVAVACVVLLGIAAVIYLWQGRDTTPGITETQQGEKQYKDDVKPGKRQASLKLADGQTLVIDSTRVGVLAKQGNATLVNENGKLIYYATGATSQQQELYNTLTTARGQTYSTTLADGSKIWLNAESSITYPVTFTGNKRKVYITGEAYYEVAKDSSKPFIVKVYSRWSEAEAAEIEVTGTRFNVMAYANEPAIQTTLVEGSVKIHKGDTIVPLKPGQQAIITQNTIEVATGVDVDKFTAWMIDEFRFIDSDIETIMRQLERWYDIQVKYKGNIPSIKLAGKLNRNVGLSYVLRSLEKSGLYYKMEGRQLIITR